jgi:hypothetical protein
VEKRTANFVYRALSGAAHGKGASPCKMLPCALCRAPRRKTHGKGFAVRFLAFAALGAHGKAPVSCSATLCVNQPSWFLTPPYPHMSFLRHFCTQIIYV